MTPHPSSDRAIFTWGKYKGYSLSHVFYNNQSYLHWIISTAGIPLEWKTASQLTLDGQDISHLSIARALIVQSTAPAHPNTHKEVIVTMYLVNEKTTAVEMPYNQALMAKFKYEIDGRTWNAKEKRWEFPTVHLVKAFEVFGEKNIKCDEQVLRARDELQTRRSELDIIREQEDVENFKIDGLLLELYGYQKSGVLFLERTNGRALIADQPGLGKTAQAIAYAQHKKLKTLVVCPLSVVVNWERQIKLFTGKTATIWDTKGKVGRADAQFHIIHYDAVGKIVKDLIALGFDLLVCDEATFLKNRQTIRAKSVLGAWKERKKYPGIKTKHTIFLTGTPVMSRPIEAYHLLNFLDKDRFNNFYHFVQRYGGWKGDAPRNLHDLHERTKDLVIRRQKSQIQKELPDKQRNDLYVELTKAERKEYDTLLMEVFGKWRIERPSVAHLPKLQSFLIDKKLPRLKEMIDEYLDNDRPVLVFSNYLAPLKALHDHYGDTSALLTGEMKKSERQNSIDRLTDGSAKVGLFSLTAAGMGIDGLQKQIDTVVFLNMDWTPANHEQAEDRTHRVGQKHQVQVFYMVCAGTIDEYMRDILKEKQKVADLVVDGAAITPERGKSFFKEFVSKLKTSYTEDFSLENIEE